MGGGDHSLGADCLLTHQLCGPGPVTWPSCALVSSPGNGDDPCAHPSGPLPGLKETVCETLSQCLAEHPRWRTVLSSVSLYYYYRMDERTTAGQGRCDCQAGQSGWPQAWDPAATSEQRPGSSRLGPQPLGQVKLSPCPAPWRAAGGITPRWAPSPARLYLPSRAARFLSAAQWLPVRGRQSPSVLSGPPAGEGAPSSSHHPGRVGLG